METQKRIDLRPMLIWSGAILAFMLIVSAVAWVMLPAGQQMPVHWGISGQPDRYGGKFEGLLTMPFAALFLMGLFALITRIEPRGRNLALSTKAYTTICLSSLGLLAVTHLFIVLTALGVKMDISRVMPLGMGILFIIVGNYLGKIRSNWFAGIRTPWTLSSEYSWAKTHRFGGKLFMLVGVLILIAVLLNNAALVFVLMMGELVLVGLMLMIYSYLAWKSDPERSGGRPNGGLKTVAVITYVLMFMLAGTCFALAAIGARQQAVLIPTAKNVVQSQAAGDFAGAERDFDSIMKSALPESKLKGVWQGVVSQLGTYEGIGSTRYENLLIFRSVYLTARFMKGEADFKVVFGPTGKVSGLWITGTRPK